MSDIAGIIWIALAVYVFCGVRKWNKRFAELLDELKEEQNETTDKEV